MAKPDDKPTPAPDPKKPDPKLPRFLPSQAILFFQSLKASLPVPANTVLTWDQRQGTAVGIPIAVPAEADSVSCSAYGIPDAALKNPGNSLSVVLEYSSDGLNWIGRTVIPWRGDAAATPRPGAPGLPQPGAMFTLPAAGNPDRPQFVRLSGIAPGLFSFGLVATFLNADGSVI